MTPLKLAHLDTDDKHLLCKAINNFGEGSHPYATHLSIVSFGAEYALECLEKAKAVGHSNPLVVEQVYALAIKLEEFLKTQPSTI